MSRPLPLLAALALVSAWAPGASAADVEARLKSGERVFGERLDAPEAILAINRKVWTRNGLIVGRAEYQRSAIAEMEIVTSLSDLYQKHSAETPDTFDGQYQLAKWCMDRGLQDEAFAHAKRLYARDPKDEVAQGLLQDLGYLLDEGQWIKRADYAAKHGMVEYEGKLMTPAQVALRKTEIKTGFERDAQAHKVRTLDAAVPPLEKRLADSKARVEKLKADLQANKAEEAKAKQVAAKNKATLDASPYAQKAKDIEKAITDAGKVVDTASKSLQQSKDELAAGKTALDTCEQATVAAHKAYVDSWPAGQIPATGSVPAASVDPAPAPLAAAPAANPTKAK